MLQRELVTPNLNDSSRLMPSDKRNLTSIFMEFKRLMVLGKQRFRGLPFYVDMTIASNVATLFLRLYHKRNLYGHLSRIAIALPRRLDSQYSMSR
ncbi:hypothetical protein M514_16284 [Trichuris suis]|uniref:Uncharacterized protein n=1 Tax=Trichuris suis TaxID=68888 RepID=A0A085NPF6_9BILA|nr:hypothetical protein M514_16284 [Trichuris suis]